MPNRASCTRLLPHGASTIPKVLSCKHFMFSTKPPSLCAPLLLPVCRAVVRPRFAGRLFQEARETMGSMDAAGLVALSYVMANSVGG